MKVKNDLASPAPVLKTTYVPKGCTAASLDAAATAAAESDRDRDRESQPSVEEENLEDYRYGGYHPCDIGETFKHDRYVIVRKLGWGYFSTVWLAKDQHDDNNYVALKVVRASQNYTETAIDEIKLLKRLNDADPNHIGRHYVVALKDEFIHVGPNGAHVCMVFELLGENLLSLMKRYHYKGIPPVLVKQIAVEVLLALDYTNRKCGMIHTDIKPENVLIRIFDVRRVIDEMESLFLEETENERRDLFIKEQLLQGEYVPPKVKQHHSYVRGSQPLTSPLMRPDSARGSSQSSTNSSLRHRDATGSPLEEPPFPTPTNGHRATGRTMAPSPPSSYFKEEGEPRPIGGGFTALEEEFVTVKIADFGSACAVDHHFTDDIQTRQYRAPEVLLGADWGASVDSWSVACMIFELLTGDYLFEPQKSSAYSKDDDHIAQIIELLGPLPAKLLNGKQADLFFDSRGRLRKIHNLKVWPLYDVFIGKYDYPPATARALCDLLLPMLDLDPAARVDCGSLIHCEWLKDVKISGLDRKIEVDRDPSIPAEKAIPGWSHQLVQSSEKAEKDLEESQRELNDMWLNGDTPTRKSEER